MKSLRNPRRNSRNKYVSQINIAEEGRVVLLFGLEASAVAAAGF